MIPDGVEQSAEKISLFVASDTPRGEALLREYLDRLLREAPFALVAVHEAVLSHEGEADYVAVFHEDQRQVRVTCTLLHYTHADGSQDACRLFLVAAEASDAEVLRVARDTWTYLLHVWPPHRPRPTATSTSAMVPWGPY